jgi:hypothetical protein
MYDQGKSGYWISESKEIKKPYYGSEMLWRNGKRVVNDQHKTTCGIVIFLLMQLYQPDYGQSRL